MVRTVFEMAGASVSFGDGYPGWKPNPHSEILEIAAESYKRLFGVDAKIKGYPCRTGVRVIPRQISLFGYDFLRAYPAGSTLSR